MIKSEIFFRKETQQNYELKEFFDKTFKYFHKEIFLLRSTIFSEKKQYKVFALIERAWVGVLNNAIIKAFPDDSVTLQEYGVYGNDEKLHGRSDLLVRWTNKKEEEFYLLFEAKCYEEVKEKELYIDTESYFKPIIDQAQKYYDVEKEYYSDKKAYLVVISFGWIRKEGMIEKAKEYFHMDNKEDSYTDFCYLYYEGKEGMWVYGKICLPEKK
jgi:hypothetical protein